jgi:phycocyanobilin:ferredoxin oxidoreductase
MMSYKVILDNIADIVKEIIINKGEGTQIEIENFGWINLIYESKHFRFAHIERYSDKNLEVLHITTFPHKDSSHPIFGFDIITTDKKPLAAFLDYSPVFSDISYKTNIVFENQYKLPEWANNIFSKNAIAIIPTEEDLYSLTKIVEDAYQKYINLCIDYKPIPYPYQTVVKDKQNYYCEQQQKNERTFNVLKAKLGEDRARYFMNTILFPKIN